MCSARAKSTAARLVEADQLTKLPVAGNAHSDHDLWEKLYNYANNTANPTSGRAAVIRKMDELTGDTEAVGTDAEIVEAYEQNMTDLGVPMTHE